MFYYIHIPFCKSKCKYCHFSSFVGVNDEKRKRYLNHLRDEIKGFLISRPVSKTETIYFGGGTPSLLSIREINDLLSLFEIDEKTEITLEANPETINEEYAEGLKKSGITRISLGIQTLNPLSSRMIGRCDPEMTIKALEILANAGFQNISIDMIIGLPLLKRGDTIKDLSILKKHDSIKHVSIYMLEDGDYPEKWKAISMDEESLGEEYAATADFLEEEGFLRYELSNFAKPGFASKHNSAYWNHDEYRGFGLGASSFIGNERFGNADDFEGYFEGKKSYKEALTKEEIELEKLMFGFRTVGLDSSLIKSTEKLKMFENEGLIRNRNGRISIMNKGGVLADFLLRELFF